MKERIAHFFLFTSVFLLPWQTRYIFDTLTISGDPSEYGVLSIYVVEVFVVLAYVFSGRLKYSIGVQKIIKAFYVILAAAFFSLTFSHYSTIGWFHLLHVLNAFLLFSLIANQRTDIKKLAYVFAGGLLIPAGLGIYQIIAGGSGALTLLGLAAKDVSVAGVAVVETASSRMMRAYGSFPHPNIFGGFLVVGLLLLTWGMRFIHSKKYLWITGFLVVILSSALIMTFSRGAWFAMVIACIVMVVQMLLQKKILPSRAIPLITLGLLTVLITLGVFHNQVLARFDSSLHVEAISIEERASQYISFNTVFFSSSLMGVGPGAYVFSLADIDSGHEVWSYQPVHNTFLLFMAELGIFGFLMALRWIWMIKKQIILKKMSIGGIFAISLCSALVIIGLFDHYLWSFWPGLALSAVALGYITRYSFDQ